MSKPFSRPLATATVVAPRKVKEVETKSFVPKSSRKPFGSSTQSSCAPPKVSNSTSLLQKRSIASLFDDDDEDISQNAPPPKKPLIKLLDNERDDLDAFSKIQSVDTKDESKDDDEVDPLEAFMCDIEKKPVTTNTHKGIRNDIEAEDEHDTFIPQSGNINLQETDDVNYGSDDEGYLDYIRSESDKDKKFIEPLPVVYHSEIEYAPFKKNFYIEHPEITSLSNNDISQYRKQIDIRVTGENIPSPAKSFMHLGLGERLMKVIEKQEFKNPTPIQCQAIPAALLGRDVIGIAKTGSGKTASFVWPMLIHIKAQPPLQKGDGPIGVVVAPTRELAQQIYLETKKYAKPFKLRVCPIYGGVPKAEQVKELKKGVEILICTPGRLIDVIKMKKITNMKRVTYLVFDEADKMFNMGFEIQVRSIAGQIRPDRQTLLFSATFKKTVENVARDILTNPIRISVGIVGEANADVNQYVHVIKDDSEKWNWLISRLNGFQSHGSVLIFVGTKNASEELSLNLNRAGFNTMALHGDKLQQERDDIMRQYKSQKFPILVATDVVARGLDIKSIKTVVNFDVARDIDSHIHRIGRTCRAGTNDGIAYTLIGPKNNSFAGPLIQNLKAAKQTIPQELVSLAMTDRKYRDSSRGKSTQKGNRGRGGFSGRGSSYRRGGTDKPDRDYKKPVQFRPASE